MKYHLMVVINKPGESPAVTTQEYNTKEAAIEAKSLMEAMSRGSTIFSAYCLITEKGAEYHGPR